MPNESNVRKKPRFSRPDTWNAICYLPYWELPNKILLYSTLHTHTHTHTHIHLYTLRVAVKLHPYIHSNEHKNRPKHDHNYTLTIQVHDHQTRQAQQQKHYIPNSNALRQAKITKRTPTLTLEHLNTQYLIIWNQLPQQIRNTTNLKTFEQELKQHLLNEQHGHIPTNKTTNAKTQKH